MKNAGWNSFNFLSVDGRNSLNYYVKIDICATIQSQSFEYYATPYKSLMLKKKMKKLGIFVALGDFSLQN